MKTITKSLSIAAIISTALLLQGCFNNPTTGRKSLNIVPDATLSSLSGEQYATFLKEHKKVSNTADAAMVQRVGNKLAAAIVQYYSKKGQSSVINGYHWEFNLVQDPQKNAFCMPGGKVVIYTGILPVTKNETGLAVVMSHEIAHAVARHGNERMSQGLVQQGIGTGLNIALANKSTETRNLFNSVYGVGSTVFGILPYSRLHESEADAMGLDYMAMAGYNPSEAIAFWKRMSTSGGNKPPEFLSTHPSDQTRINNLQKKLPAAMAIYNGHK